MPTRTEQREERVPRDDAGRERRLVAAVGVTVRAADTDDGPIGFTGHAAVFDKRTWIGPSWWGFYEEVAQGAFRKTIGEADVRFLHNHDPNLVLARNRAGNLRLAEDDTGLAVDADMTPTSYARDLALSLAAGDVTQMSFAFRAVRSEWLYVDPDGNLSADPPKGPSSELRRLLEVELFDVSTVTYPAYADTDAGLRAGQADGHQGLDAAAEHLGVSPADRARLAAGLRAGRVDDDLQPLLAAAADLIAGYNRGQNPDPDPDPDPDPAAAGDGGRDVEGRRRRARAHAARYQLPV